MNKYINREMESDDDVTIIGGSEWNPNKNRGKKEGRWKVAAIVLAVLVFCGIGAYVIKVNFHRNEFIPSRPVSEIIESLSTPMKGTPGIKAGIEEAMGVKVKTYLISGLKAHFADTVPDYSDSSIFLITRSADYKLIDDKRQIIGDYIDNGEVIASSNWRAGFMAIDNGNVQIGVSRSPKIFKHIQSVKGSMFRQFALVSAGIKCSSQFELKGKVTRCAYALRSGNLYFIESLNPETLHGFSDALVELGFVDAIYITGGSQPDLFYRNSDGSVSGNFVDDKPHYLVIWTNRN